MSVRRFLRFCRYPLTADEILENINVNQYSKSLAPFIKSSLFPIQINQRNKITATKRGKKRNKMETKSNWRPTSKEAC